MPADAEYAQRTFLEEKKARWRDESVHTELRQLRESVRSLEAMVRALRQDLKTIKDMMAADA
ncbi:MULTISPECIES: hypothetical protein [Desulfovibrio]|jgi:cell division protein FtsB|uniref:hypothetical protein n=1 Tax=Desulfovibrio TaxID=872 RepID=UPI00040D012E|nr:MULTISPECIES: hypothetical protein [Desulfovibrio]MDY0306540.1 hypothetical protein [Desulfovibrionaceae bacterium]HMM38255.1 hypothetical protein [Desulfovibrio sp.]